MSPGIWHHACCCEEVLFRPAVFSYASNSEGVSQVDDMLHSLTIGFPTEIGYSSARDKIATAPRLTDLSA